MSVWQRSSYRLTCCPVQRLSGHQSSVSGSSVSVEVRHEGRGKMILGFFCGWCGHVGVGAVKEISDRDNGALNAA